MPSDDCCNIRINRINAVVIPAEFIKCIDDELMFQLLKREIRQCYSLGSAVPFIDYQDAIAALVATHADDKSDWAARLHSIAGSIREIADARAMRNALDMPW